MSRQTACTTPLLCLQWTYLSHACALAGFHSRYFSYRVRHLHDTAADTRECKYRPGGAEGVDAFSIPDTLAVLHAN